jgi:hypothetical protein
LTLSCDGTAKNILATNDDDKPEKITKLGILVNLADQTVMGFGHPARITKVDAVSVELKAHGKDVSDWSIDGTVDRITGSITATELASSAKGALIIGTSWDLTCTPTKRVF